ncbi:MAG: twin-arginine translocase TatA/TatE family subunit [Candidatus Omnitrophica bacterium]|nr:twin-arginine translocase TatA/TatE family subunit [Candidatus Omnitrophota bacterium]
MFGLGMGELMVILFIILLLFGSKNLPELARTLGKSMREFKKATSEIKETIDAEMTMDTKPVDTNGKTLELNSKKSS